MKKILFVLALLSTQPAFALLPPLNQSIQELQGIFNSSDLTQYLPSSEKIISIEAVDTGYTLKTQGYTILVEVQYIPAKGPGPAHFKLIFHQPTQIKNR